MRYWSRPKKILKTIEKNIKLWQENNDGSCNILILGITDKPDAPGPIKFPAKEIIEALTKKKNIKIFIADPYLKKEKLTALFKEKAISVQDGLSVADILIYLVAHKTFKKIDKNLLKNKLIIDFYDMTQKSTYCEKRNEREYATSCILDFFIATQQRSLQHEK